MPSCGRRSKRHLQETQGQIARLEQVFESLDEKVRGKHCDGIAGIIEEGKSIMEEDFDETTMDACLIAAGQRAEHYEMAAYGTLVAWAQAMGHTEAAKLLQQTLDEEKAADKKLSGLAEGGINQSAADAAHPEDDEEPVGASRQQCEKEFGEGRSPVALRAVEGAMVLIQLLLPTNGAASADGLAPRADSGMDRSRGVDDRRRNAARVSKVMRHVFGLAELRPGQQAVIDAVLAKCHTLAIMPTGAGKSLCYQVPAMLMPGMTRDRLAADRVDARSVRQTVGARLGGRSSQ